METTIKNKVVVEKVEANQFGAMQAQLRFIASGLTGSLYRSQLFTAEELGKESYDNTRVDWIEVPKDSTVESVQSLIDQYPKARITRYLSSKPIIDAPQEAVLYNGLRGDAFEDFKKTHGIVADEWNQECATALLNKIVQSQIVRYGENNSEGKPADELVLHNGKAQYRITRFNIEGDPDIDKRDGVAKLISLELADNPNYVAENVNADEKEAAK